MHDEERWARVQMWKPLREVLQAADGLFGEAERLRAAAEVEAAAPPPRKAGQPPPPPAAPAAYLRRRGELCEAISAQLDPVLSDALGPWDKHVCIMVVTSFIDERERVALGGLGETWRLPLLQSRLLDIDDGGDRCFVQLQELLGRADVHEPVFEVYLLCLRAGFVGRYRDRRHELDKLVGRVVDRLRRYRPPPTALAVAAPPAPPPRVGFLGFPLRYYVAVALAVAALFAVLRVLSTREVDHSSLAESCHFRGPGVAP